MKKLPLNSAYFSIILTVVLIAFQYRCSSYNSNRVTQLARHMGLEVKDLQAMDGGH